MQIYYGIVLYLKSLNKTKLMKMVIKVENFTKLEKEK